MNRLLQLALAGLVACLLLPAVARAAQAAIPLLISLLIFLAIAKLAWPSGGRR